MQLKEIKVSPRAITGYVQQLDIALQLLPIQNGPKLEQIMSLSYYSWIVPGNSYGLQKRVCSGQKQ